MPLIGVHADAERLQKRWILGALGIALVIHLGVAGAMGWYKIPGLEMPFSHTPATGPFTVKQIEINPDAFKSQDANPISNLPTPQPPTNPAQFGLDPNSVERALQTPQPTLATPTVPEPDKVIAASDLTQNLPSVESDTAKVSEQIEQVEPTTSGSPLTSSKMAEQLINASSGPVQPGTAAGGPANVGNLPGFSDLAPGFKPPAPSLTNLPEPVLLRLPSDVLFDFDSATLKPEADPLLSQAIGLITKYPEADIHVDGYSDSFGKPDYNTTLSQQRAESVQAWLQQRITQSTYNFHSTGHGSTDYVVAPTGSIEAQQPNRRVEILIQATKP